jgi:hypothetical protein
LNFAWKLYFKPIKFTKVANRASQASQDQLVPLMSEAAFKGDVAMMERLVAKGASVNQHDQV